MSTQAKPTEYRGVNFRSRSEARLAVCFDAAGWKWEYEPHWAAMSVKGWTPDFWLDAGNKNRNYLIEYKPTAITREYDVVLRHRFHSIGIEDFNCCLIMFDFFNNVRFQEKCLYPVWDRDHLIGTESSGSIDCVCEWRDWNIFDGFYRPGINHRFDLRSW